MKQDPQAKASGRVREKNSSEQELLANAFVWLLRQMNREMDLPGSFTQIKEEDLDQMAQWAVQEANPLYPVPVIYDQEDVKRILRAVGSDQ